MKQFIKGLRIKSFESLRNAPYNRQHPFKAVIRVVAWKTIRLFRLKKTKISLWGDKKLIVHYDSFQCMWLFYNYIVDYEEFILIKDYVMPGDDIADVGTNVGYYTIWMSKFIISPGRIHSFEPDPLNFKRLRINCELNNLTNVKLNNVAVSDKIGNLSFTKSLDEKNHISPTSNDNTITVETISFDAYAEREKIINFSYVKVDIEGFELSFLNGAAALLARKAIDIIQVELNEQVFNSDDYINNILEKIKQIGYRLCQYDYNKKLLIETFYSVGRDNYFLISDVEKVNRRLNKNKIF